MNSVCIKIGNGDQYAIIDADDSAAVSAYRWEYRNGYAMRRARKNGTRQTVSMHRLIAGAESGQLIDHINRNPLDNRKANLRIATPSQNNANQDTSRKYKGAYKNAKGTTWSAKLCGKHLGNFSTELDAAKAYDAAAIQKYGEFAKLNFG